MSRLLLVAALAFSAIPAKAQITRDEYASRRAAFAERVPDSSVVIALGAAEPDENYLSFVQTPHFNYLTGVSEPEAALMLVKRNGVAKWTLFVEPRDAAQEAWTGSRLGQTGATALTGIPARPLEELRPTLDSAMRAGLRPYMVINHYEGGTATRRDQALLDSLRTDTRPVGDLSSLVNTLRGRKSPAELDLIRKAVDLTVTAHKDVMRLMEPGLFEFEAQALLEYDFRRYGGTLGFASIVGSGSNSTTLHYNADDRQMNAGEVVVVDIGAAYRGYSADVTRTIPVSGTFSPAQRDIYQLVRDAQKAAERQAVLGGSRRAMSDSASATLAAGLTRLGLMDSPIGTYDCDVSATRQCRQLSLYYFHGLGHGIGLDVHDPDQYGTGPIAPGSVFTIEPGIYVRPALMDIIPDTPKNRQMIAKIRAAFDKYRSIGVRIEDDYLATDKGVEWISRAPREIAEVEAMMREPYTGPSPRDPARVQWYRRTGPTMAGATAP